MPGRTRSVVAHRARPRWEVTRRWRGSRQPGGRRDCARANCGSASARRAQRWRFDVERGVVTNVANSVPTTSSCPTRERHRVVWRGELHAAAVKSLALRERAVSRTRPRPAGRAAGTSRTSPGATRRWALRLTSRQCCTARPRAECRAALGRAAHAASRRRRWMPTACWLITWNGVLQFDRPCPKPRSATSAALEARLRRPTASQALPLDATQVLALPPNPACTPLRPGQQEPRRFRIACGQTEPGASARQRELLYRSWRRATHAECRPARAAAACQALRHALHVEPYGKKPLAWAAAAVACDDDRGTHAVIVRTVTPVRARASAGDKISSASRVETANASWRTRDEDSLTA